MNRNSTKSRAIEALGATVRSTQPGLAWHENPRYAATYLSDPEDNVLPHLREAFWPQAKQELLAGDGSELTPNGTPAKFSAAHSSSGLGVNSFAPWRGRSQDLVLSGFTNFNGPLEFERKCPHGFQGKAPNLDVLLEDGTAVYGVESKLTEWLVPSHGVFSDKYVSIPDTDPRKDTAWYRAMMLAREKPETFAHLNAAQLIKHFYGLAREFEGRPVRVVYIYWEPVNADDFPEFAAHRAEIEKFASLVQGDDDKNLFESLSYLEHWHELSAIADPPSWLPEHLAAVRDRYEIEI